MKQHLHNSHFPGPELGFSCIYLFIGLVSQFISSSLPFLVVGVQAAQRIGWNILLQSKKLKKNSAQGTGMFMNIKAVLENVSY